MSDRERRGEDRPHDWLFDTLDRMEKSELRHSSEQRMDTANILRKLEEHIRDDHDVQADMQSALQSLQDASEFDEKTRATRQAWLIALSSIAGAAMLKIMDVIVSHH